ncbi:MULTISPECIES: hypothetical protein [unclassified Vibrio]|uniref:hypothetical protein n=1 Tax=unclassified Vibrio TaxID=2614977 RepID=UPI0012691397|nr:MULTISPECIES: hypothetical protein [unclassified Vibrio]QFT40072.1 hypothetical protein FIU99_27150 [Vibrio sp. THAF64]QGM38017.1 hypothetical protein GGC04_27355 [Vibrio sp. THAF191d]QGN73523.1 hypothetical protein GGC03_27420 [Vibrio sp. THAF191c]
MDEISYSSYQAWNDLVYARCAISARVPEVMMVSTPSSKPEIEWLNRANEAKRYAKFYIGADIKPIGHIKPPLPVTEQELGITISHNPFYSSPFSKSIVTTAVSAVLNTGRQHHQRKAEYIAARSGKYCSHEVIKRYIGWRNGYFSLPDFIQLTTEYELTEYQRDMLDVLVYGTKRKRA